MDPFRPFGGTPRKILLKEETVLLRRQDPLNFAAEMISRHELRVWFEPDWRLARQLALWFPLCTVVSIPLESNTVAHTKTPAWRRAKSNGASV